MVGSANKASGSGVAVIGNLSACISHNENYMQPFKMYLAWVTCFPSKENNAAGDSMKCTKSSPILDFLPVGAPERNRSIFGDPCELCGHYSEARATKGST